MSDVVADIERAIGGYEEGAWVPESHATIEHISLMRRAASELALLRRAEKLLRRLREWDMMSTYVGVDGVSHEVTGDGRYWREEIDKALEYIKEQETT